MQGGNPKGDDGFCTKSIPICNIGLQVAATWLRSVVMSLAFCSRQISTALSNAVETAGCLPSYLQNALLILRFSEIAAFKLVVAQVLRSPDKVTEILVAEASSIEQCANLRATVLKTFHLANSDKTAFKSLQNPVLFVSTSIDQPPNTDYFWMDEPTLGSTLPSGWLESFPEELRDHIPLMGSDILNQLVQGDPHNVYINVDINPHRILACRQFWKLRVAGGLSRTCIREMVQFMSGVRPTKRDMAAFKAQLRSSDQAYLFRMHYLGKVQIAWAIPFHLVEDTSSSQDLTNSTLVQGELKVWILSMLFW